MFASFILLLKIMQLRDTSLVVNVSFLSVEVQESFFAFAHEQLTSKHIVRKQSVFIRYLSFPCWFCSLKLFAEIKQRAEFLKMIHLIDTLYIFRIMYTFFLKFKISFMFIDIRNSTLNKAPLLFLPSKYVLFDALNISNRF